MPFYRFVPTMSGARMLNLEYAKGRKAGGTYDRRINEDCTITISTLREKENNDGYKT